MLSLQLFALHYCLLPQASDPKLPTGRWQRTQTLHCSYSIGALPAEQGQMTQVSIRAHRRTWFGIKRCDATFGLLRLRLACSQLSIFVGRAGPLVLGHVVDLMMV